MKCFDHSSPADSNHSSSEAFWSSLSPFISFASALTASSYAFCIAAVVSAFFLALSYTSRAIYCAISLSRFSFALAASKRLLIRAILARASRCFLRFSAALRFLSYSASLSFSSRLSLSLMYDSSTNCLYFLLTCVAVFMHFQCLFMGFIRHFEVSRIAFRE